MEKQKEFRVKVLGASKVTHDVRRFVLEKPHGFSFVPGQATDLSIDKPGLRDKINPFTFTCLTSDPYLEFTIKMYEDREDGVTKHLKDIRKDDYFIIREPFGAIHYKGKGTFIAGGAGITPFIAILRMLEKEKKLEGNTLIFSNKTKEDIILEDEFREMEKKGLKLIFTLTREKIDGYENRRIDENFLKEKINNFKQHFYICGPTRMVGELQSFLRKLGAESEGIVIET